MRIKEGYAIKHIGSEHVIIKQGRVGVDMTKIISFNPVSEWLWEKLAGCDFTGNEVANLLVAQYGIDAEKAAADVDRWIGQLTEAQLLEA
ncbi:MAG: PqqD family protein [Dysgonamonadaceae bacterium]|jgi:hypothetical protein|nr:PqqD family protein [Dysgonamonadaceae bacterium]